MIDALQYDFMRHALIAALLVSIAGGIVGTLIVIKRIVFISGGISHAAFGGIGLGYLIGVNPVLTAIPFSLAAAISIGIISKKARISEDAAIGMIWTVGMALGILFIGLAPGYAPDLFSFLFGSILTVSLTDILIMLVLDAIIIILISLFFKEFQALAFDPEFAEIVGVPTQRLYLLLLGLVALSIIVLIRVIGIILVIALLTIPANIARQFTNRFRPLMVYATIVAILLTLAGIILSYLLNLPSGATIILALTAVFLITAGLKRLPVRIRKKT
jgi:zinc transport system permease protein